MIHQRKNIVPGALALPIILAIVASSCGKLSNKSEVMSTRGSFNLAQFNDLPSLPGGASVTSFESMLTPSGGMIKGKANRDTQIATADKTCSIKKDASIALVAQVTTNRGEKMLIAQPLRASDCTEAPANATAEGYVLASDVNVTNQPFGKSPGTERLPGTNPNGEGLPGDPSNPNGEGLPGDPSNPNGEGLPPGTGFCQEVIQIERDRQGADECTSECGIPGESFRTGGGDLALQVTIKGSADQLQVKIDEDSWFFNDDWGSGDRTMGTKTVAVDPNATKLTVEYLNIIDNPNDWRSTGVKFHITASKGGQPLEGSCDFKVRLMSPIVLDLSHNQQFSTLEHWETSVHFDLDGNGTAERTGWLAPQTGLLAIDLNGNGVIDNGRELFGDATLTANGSLATNGYIALNQYADGKSFIDEKNPNFSKLRVWIDANSNGHTEKGELVTLAELGINRISTSYTEVEKSKQQRVLFGNTTKYQGKFWGPSYCGAAGCNSYDVYFATSSLSLSQAGHK